MNSFHARNLTCRNILYRFARKFLIRLIISRVRNILHFLPLAHRLGSRYYSPFKTYLFLPEVYYLKLFKTSITRQCNQKTFLRKRRSSYFLSIPCFVRTKRHIFLFAIFNFTFPQSLQLISDTDTTCIPPVLRRLLRYSFL